MAYDDPRPFGLQSVWVARTWNAVGHKVRGFGYTWDPNPVATPALVGAVDVTGGVATATFGGNLISGPITVTATGTGTAITEVVSARSSFAYQLTPTRRTVVTLSDTDWTDARPYSCANARQAQSITLRAASVTSLDVYLNAADDELDAAHQVESANVLFSAGTDIDSDPAVLYIFNGFQTANPTPTNGDAITLVIDGEARHVARMAAANSMTFSHSYKTGEMQGNDQIVAVGTRLASLEGDLESGGIDFDAYEIMLGQDIALNTTTGTTEVTGSNVNPYFKISGVVTDPNAQGSTEVVIYRAKLNSLEGSFSDAKFLVTSGSLMAIKESDASDNIYDLYAYETQVARDLSTF